MRSFDRTRPRLQFFRLWGEAMDLERLFRSAWRIGVSACRLGWWCLATTWLGGQALCRVIKLAGRCRDIFGQTMPCPRGHRVPTYGVFECRCGALHEGWVFGRCRVCKQTAGWTPCPKCKLAVRTPLI